MAKSVLVLNGPNLNLLGLREPQIYGTDTLAQIEALVAEEAARLGLAVQCRQSNHEGQLIDWIQQAQSTHHGIIINAGAYSHTSLAIHDALKAVGLPVLEVHLSNIFRREAFRHHSYVSLVAVGVICGLGATGYRLALQALNEKL